MADKNVLLYSGGMDSYIMLNLLPYDKAVYFNLGTEDGKREIAKIDAHKELRDKIEIIDLPIARFELPSKCLPFRNGIMVLLAANFGNVVHLGAIKDDVSKDKDFVFKNQMEGVLNYFGMDDYRVNFVGYPYEVKMPFIDKMKNEIVAAYLFRYGEKSIDNLLTRSWSCYNGGEKECGYCSNCMRKYAAIRANGIEVYWHFENDPRIQLPRFIKNLEKKDRPEELTVFRQVQHMVEKS